MKSSQEQLITEFDLIKILKILWNKKNNYNLYYFINFGRLYIYLFSKIKI